MIFSLLTFLSCHYIYSETTIGANPLQFKLRDWNHKGFIYPYNCYQFFLIFFLKCAQHAAHNPKMAYCLFNTIIWTIADLLSSGP